MYSVFTENYFSFLMLKTDISIHVTCSFRVLDCTTAESVKSRDSPPNSPDLNLPDYTVWNERKQLVHNNQGNCFSPSNYCSIEMKMYGLLYYNLIFSQSQSMKRMGSSYNPRKWRPYSTPFLIKRCD